MRITTQENIETSRVYFLFPGTRFIEQERKLTPFHSLFFYFFGCSDIYTR